MAHEEGEQDGEVYAVRTAACEEVECLPDIACTHGIHQREYGHLGHLRERRTQIVLCELGIVCVERQLFQLAVEELKRNRRHDADHIQEKCACLRVHGAPHLAQPPVQPVLHRPRAYRFAL